MTKVEKPQTHPNELTEVLQGMGQSLRRLVKVGESLLVVLEPASATPAAKAEAGIGKTSAPSSVGCSAGSKESTGEGVFDLSKEDVVSFAVAARMVPTDPPPSTSTISRWCTLGCRKIKLESFYIGGRRKTTKQAVERFLLRCRNQDWAGMHAGTAFFLEQVMAEKELLDGQQASHQTSRNDQAQPATQHADSTEPTGRKAGRKVSTRGKPTPRQTKRGS